MGQAIFFKMDFPYKAALFDWAYTLVDLVNEEDRTALRIVYDHLVGLGHTLPDFRKFYDSYHHLFFGMIDLSRPTHREARFDQVLNYLLIQSNVELKNQAGMEELLKLYYGEIYSHRLVYPDVEPALKELRQAGVRMGIVSNTTNPGPLKDHERRQVGLDGYFEFSIYSSEVPYRKPHPSIFQLALDRLKLGPKEVLFVGDNVQADVIGAQHVGIPAAWLNRNGNVCPKGVHPTYEISSMADLLTLSAPA